MAIANTGSATLLDSISKGRKAEGEEKGERVTWRSDMCSAGRTLGGVGVLFFWVGEVDGA